MAKQGYVSLGVALCAALGVHAFVLFYTMQPEMKLVDTQPMQIDLLPQPLPMQKQSFKDTPQPKTPAKPKASIVVKHAPKASSVHVKPPVSAPVSAQKKNKVIQDVPQTVPKPIQQNILASIVYPRQAKRRGWEGTAKFSLDVQQQMIREVTLLVSTGYKTLDNAAEKGIAAIDSLPLSDGKHILPVSFYLQ